MMLLSPVQESYIDNYVREIISSLPPKAIQELLSGYENDLDRLLSVMREQTCIVTHMDRTLDMEKLEYLANVEKSMDLSLRKQSYNYFKTVCLPTFRQGWRNLEWGNLFQLYLYNCILASRSSGKCLSPETEIVMADGTIRKIKDVSIGDQVMGPDSKPRTVLSLHKGRSRMWKVKQTWGIDYVVNEGHIVCCKKKVPSRYEKRIGKDMRWKTFNIPVEEIPSMPGYTQRKIMGYRTKGWDLPEKDLPVDPYLLGLWLGDGLYTEPVVTTIDHEIIEYLNEFCEKNGFILSKHNSNKYSYRIIEKERLFKNRLKTALKDLGVLGNKHIPEIYLLGSREQRLKLLAGLIDTDGSSQYKKGNPRSKYAFEIGFKDRNLIEQTQRLAQSLGFRCNSIITRTADVKVKTLKGENILHDYTHYRITISGDVDEIPVKIERKKIPSKITVQDNLSTSLKVECIGDGDYVGFSCDGDHLFLLKDGTVVHNSYEGCFAFILWRLYSYDRPTMFLRDSIDNKNRKETCMITNNETLGKKHIAMIISEIEQNDILREKLNRNGKAKLAATSITTETDSILHLRSKDSMIRGLHVGAVVCDDLPDESSLYSQEQREKLHEVFYGSITPIVEPFGYLCVLGCVRPDTYVFTENGLTEIGKLSPVNIEREKGFFPLDMNIHDGEGFVNATDYYVNGKTPTKIITLSNGLEIETSFIHPLLRCNSETGLFEWVNAKDLYEGDFVAFKMGSNIWGRSLGIEGEELYEIGLCIADGTLDLSGYGNRVIITKKNPGIRNFLINERGYHPKKNHIGMFFNSKEKISMWLSLGYRKGMYSHTKTIPDKIMSASEEDVIWFLRGCFDGDGCCYHRHRSDKGINVSYFSTSFRLIQQIQILLLNMGIDSRIEKKKCQSTELVKSNRTGYNLVISKNSSVKLFMEKIGFTYSGKGKVPRETKKESSCVDKGIPFQSVILRKIRSKYPLGNDKMKFYGMRSGDFYTKVHSFKRMNGPIKKWILSLPQNDPDVQIILGNINLRYHFAPIKLIIESESYTVDFRIPISHRFISNGIISHNTPYSATDIYGDLKKDGRFKVFEYPAVFPNGQLLAPDRLTFKRLTEERKSLGTLVFNREYLVVPIADTSTIFPYEFLKRSIRGMEHISFANDIENYPIKLVRVVVGCDFAISGNVGADYTVYTVWGMDAHGLIYLINIFREQGASHDLQVNKLIEFNARYKPNKSVCESNGFQRILAGMAKERGLVNVEEFITTEGNKKDLKSGLPSLSAFFESARLRVPYGDENTRKLVDTMFGEFNSIAFNSKKGTLESVCGHDDICMSSFMAIQDLRENNVQAMIDFVDLD